MGRERGSSNGSGGVDCFLEGVASAVVVVVVVVVFAEAVVLMLWGVGRQWEFVLKGVVCWERAGECIVCV